MQQEREAMASDHEKIIMKPEEQHPQREKCPRCDSLNTKFCYYNNYSLSQPRFFCKSCRRYWTHGGSLRNVPVGGGCRKPKRSKTLSASSSSSSSSSSASFLEPLPELQQNEPALCYPGAAGGYLPSMEVLQSLNYQRPILAPRIDVAGVLSGVAGYSFGSGHYWSHQSFENDSNPTVPQNSLVQNPDQWSGNLPGYGNPP